MGSDARLHQHLTKKATAMAPLHFPAMIQHYRIGTEEFVISVAQVISEVGHAIAHCSDCRRHHQRMRWCW